MNSSGLHDATARVRGSWPPKINNSSKRRPKPNWPAIQIPTDTPWIASRSISNMMPVHCPSTTTDKRQTSPTEAKEKKFAQLYREYLNFAPLVAANLDQPVTCNF